MRRAIDFFSVLALFSSSVCRSSSRRKNSRYVICSITSSGLEIPPDQKASQMRSIWFLISPVSIGRQFTSGVGPAAGLVAIR
jgi:hypothetical protein